MINQNSASPTLINQTKIVLSSLNKLLSDKNISDIALLPIKVVH